jgi:hypothetical protein
MWVVKNILQVEWKWLRRSKIEETMRKDMWVRIISVQNITTMTVTVVTANLPM